MKPQPLKRILGAWTALLIGMGVAIGSGIFRTPGEVAAHLQAPGLILLVWVLGGLVVLAQGMVTAELATRFPKAGGEYVFLREAYGDFVAFFFGWGYTVFVIGGGGATIALALGDFGCDFFRIDARNSGLLAAAAIVCVTATNAMGLRASASTQNVLTVIKILALLAIIGIGFALGSGEPGWHAQAEGAGMTDSAIGLHGRAALDHGTHDSQWPGPGAFLTGLLAVLWSYLGTTDTVKLAEEVKEVRRSLPRALIGSAGLLMLLYLAVNMALMRIVPPSEMVGFASVPGEAMNRLFGATGRNAMLLVGMLVCLGSLGSTVLATIRVTYALARDGLTFQFMSYMSKSQAPIPALIVVAAFSVVLVLNRNFGQVLSIYFFASAFLYGLSYASLIVFRLRDHAFPAQVYRCPFGIGLAVILILIQLAIAVNIARHSPNDALYTAILLGAFGLLYFVWKRVVPRMANNE